MYIYIFFCLPNYTFFKVEHITQPVPHRQTRFTKLIELERKIKFYK